MDTPRIKFGLIRLPERDCGRELTFALDELMGVDVVHIPFWIDDIPDCKAVILACRSFDPARYEKLETNNLPIFNAIKRWAANGKLILGIGGGMQLLCELGLLPGSVVENKDNMFIIRMVYVRSESSFSPLTSLIDKSKPIYLPVAHCFGRYVAKPEQLRKMRQNNQILFRYCNEFGKTSIGVNPDGSVDNIAAVANEFGNVMGILVHPERALNDNFFGSDGCLLFDSILSSIS
jgi:phosphoribosylformylglycinamidine synthase